MKRRRTAVQRHPVASQRGWEHKAAYYPCRDALSGISESSLQVILHNEGKEGWALVTIQVAAYPNALLVFKRPMP